MRHLWMILALIACMVISVPSAFAGGEPVNPDGNDIHGALTVDNHYKLYISTDDSVAGNLVTQSTINGAYVPLNDPDVVQPYDWSTPESGFTSLTPGVVNYLHIAGYDTGVVAGFLGQFDLNNSGFRFANGASGVLTGLDSGWTVRSGGFNGTLLDLTGSFKNGEGPWAFMGLTPGIDPTTPEAQAEIACRQDPSIREIRYRKADKQNL